MKKWKYLISLVIMLYLTVWIPVSAAEKQTLYNSPYVTFSPDGKAWTANAGDADYEWYDEGTTVTTGIRSSLRKLQTGEHYYKAERQGEVPIGFWRTEYRTGTCIHDAYPDEDPYYHGIHYGKSKCQGYYYSGWMAYCADCGECVNDMYMYMSEEAAESIDYMYLGSEEVFEYYYLCPHCTNLEQGAPFESHMCKAISMNQYKVQYEANCGTAPYGGYMADSIHMYNNATEYEGEAVTPITHLTKNAYTRIGYEFTGWNTKPDGSGTAYSDEAEIFNLTSMDYNDASTWTGNDEGTVFLYAQWRPSSSTLVMDANGGTYEGKAERTSIHQNYWSTYKVNNELLNEPLGYTVFFETNGGTAVSPIVSTRHFTEWSINADYKGKWYNNVYSFLAPDGNTDTLTANYALDSITLPGVTKPGSSFGGWYYDAAFRQPAGGAGDTITPTRNQTLYAQWVDLTLYARDNYTANGGKGAVDLSWTQADGNNKSYLLYQSRDAVSWSKINSAADIGNSHSVEENFSFTGSSGAYTVPYTGLYTVTAEGAQGGCYGSYQGGYGGRAAAKVWLTQGEILSYTIGGQNGYNGGGSADMFANGGGCTVVSTDRKGTILIAGGGGGAASMGSGGAGGSNASVAGAASTSGAAGQGGGAGGGGGYQGGSAGELIVHHHTPDCYHTDDYSWTVFHEGFTSAWMQQYSGCINKAQGTLGCHDIAYTPNSVSGHVGDHEDGGIGLIYTFGAINNPSPWVVTAPAFSPNYIPTNGNNKLDIAFRIHAWGGSVANDYDASCLQVFNPDGATLFRSSFTDLQTSGYVRPGSSWQNPDGSWDGSPDVVDRTCLVSVPLPAGTEGVCFRIQYMQEGEPDCWLSLTIQNVSLSGKTKTYTICGYTEGQVISSKPAYGGSNYIGENYAYSYESEAGIHAGNGSVTVQSVNIGYIKGLSLEGVKALDLAGPEIVSTDLGAITMETLGDKSVQITWQEPRDNGTDYYHVAESFLAGSILPLCRSNTTKNTLVSGVTGYYYVINGSPFTRAERNNGSFIKSKSLNVDIDEQVKYLHLAAVDAAENVGETAHIKIDAAEVLWKLYTNPLLIEQECNVYPASGNRTWYVRADGKTPFTLRHGVYLEGAANEKYQPNYTIYETLCDGKTARSIIYTPSMEISEEPIRTDAKDLSHSAEGIPLLEQYPYSYTVRSDWNRQLAGVQKFTLDAGVNGRRIEIIPVGGADRKGETIFSEHRLDSRNGLTVIGDGAPPVIKGMELLENRELINRNDQTVILNVTASDALSGVKDFYLEISNADNAVTKKFTPGENGNITVEITKDEPVFSGDFIVTAHASDNVGNESKVTYGTTEFALTTAIERILNPHTPVFKCGESGILTISTFGYADRVEVEFPEAFTAQNPDLNVIFDYVDCRQYKREETLQFMIPLYAPVNQKYEITVRAYKGDKKLEEHPSFSTVEVEGSVLEDFRTRLR